MSDRAATPSSNGRIHSLDQFRGYCVLGMLCVNFLAGLDVTPAVLEHHNTYFSYADSILPAFLFAVGFSFRLTWCKRITRQDHRTTVYGYVRRCLALVLLSLILSGLGGGFGSWSEVQLGSLGHLLARLLKANLWEVLAIIGVTQLCILPLIACNAVIRAVAMLLCLMSHIGLSYAFNFAFVLGLPNPLDSLLGTTGIRCWDGGLFGIISWSVVMLAGTLVYDLIHRGRTRSLLMTLAPPKFSRKQRDTAELRTSMGRPGTWAAQPSIVVGLLSWGLACCAVGYALNCLSTLYEAQAEAGSSRTYAESPVLPPWLALGGRSLPDLLAEPPFVAVPETRPWNYWLMSKRLVSAPFVLFATGFAFVVYAVLVVICDGWGLQWGLWRTFGQNALLAYALHHLVLKAIKPIVPADSPVWYVLIGLAVFLSLNYALVRYLERQRIFIRL